MYVDFRRNFDQKSCIKNFVRKTFFRPKRNFTKCPPGGGELGETSFRLCRPDPGWRCPCCAKKWIWNSCYQQGCQIFLDTIHQNGEIGIYQMTATLPNGLKIYLWNFLLPLLSLFCCQNFPESIYTCKVVMRLGRCDISFYICQEQGDNIGRFFCLLAIAYYVCKGSFLEHYRSIPNFWSTYFHGKNYWQKWVARFRFFHKLIWPPWAQKLGTTTRDAMHV
jgi:hypothetical protein